MDCNLPGSSVHGVLQARILEWVAISSPGNLSDPGMQLRSLALQIDSLPSEPPGTRDSDSFHIAYGQFLRNESLLKFLSVGQVFTWGNGVSKVI